MMRQILVVATTAVLAAGCPKKESTGTTTPVGSGPTKDTAAEETRAKRYEECAALSNAGKREEYNACFGADARLSVPGLHGDVLGGKEIADGHWSVKTSFPDQISQPQLVLAHDKEVIAIVHMTGTQDGPFAGGAPTGKKFGFLLGHGFGFDDAGKSIREWEYFDLATVLGQLGHLQDPVRPRSEQGLGKQLLVVAKGDETERSNLAAYKRMNEAFDRHDAKAFGELLADDSVWWIAALPADITKQELLARTETIWTSFADAKITVENAWAAGDYVVAFESFEGTETASGKKVVAPALVVHQLGGGKVTATWMFFQRFGIAKQLAPAPPAKT